MAYSQEQSSFYSIPKSIIIVGAGAFGLSTAYALLNDARYDQTSITVLDQWRPTTGTSDDSSSSYNNDRDAPASSDGVTPASIDNSRLIRPDYADAAYARLAARSQHRWRSGWPQTLPTATLGASRLPINPACGAVRARHGPQPYRESGLLLTCWNDDDAGAVGLNPKGPAYVDESMRNVLDLAAKLDPSLRGQVEVYSNRNEVRRAVGAGGFVGDRGYCNWASGWADSGAGIALLKERTRELLDARKKADGIWRDGHDGRVSRLSFATREDGSTVVDGVKVGAEDDGLVMKADLVVLATGAWTPRLLPRSVGRRIKATGQVVGYIRLSPEEAEKYGNIPCPLNLSTGLFCFPPISDGQGGFLFKAARHGWGYVYPTMVPDLEQTDGTSGAEYEVHLPAPGSGTRIGQEGSVAMKQFLRQIGLTDRPWLLTRTCWYADSATGDWLIDYVPAYGRSLLVATGDSGHGYKFAPELGSWVIKAIERTLGEPEGDEHGTVDSELGALLKNSWRWRSDEEDASNWIDGGGDGSRGGRQGMRWEDEATDKAVTGEQ